MKKLNELIIKSNRISEINIREDFDENTRLKFTAKKIAFKIFYELKNKKLTQQDLASILMVTPQNVSKLLKGDDYKLSTLVKIEEALSINLIDKEVYSNRNNVSVIVHFKSFEQKKELLIFEKNTYFLNNDFQSSSNVLEAEIYSKTISFEESINDYIIFNEI